MNTIQKGLVAIVGSAAAAGLLVLTPAEEGTVYKTYRDLGGVLTYCTGATENAIWGKTYTPAECKAQLDKDLASIGAADAGFDSMASDILLGRPAQPEDIVPTALFLASTDSDYITGQVIAIEGGMILV